MRHAPTRLRRPINLQPRVSLHAAGTWDCVSVGTGVWSNSRRTEALMCPDERPASSYCSVCVPASMKLSGSTMGRILMLPCVRK